jgi:hypothetical protein
MSKGWLSRHFDKFIWPIVGTILGGVLTPLILSWFQNKSSDIVVRQFYNTVEQKAVPKQVGGLLLDYQPKAQAPRSLYLVEISNEGNGPEEDLRLQIGFPPDMTVAYGEEPDFKVYRPEEISLNQNKFFMSLKQFPPRAKAPISFEFGKDKQGLCGIRIKAAGKEKEGRIEPIKGIPCSL